MPTYKNKDEFRKAVRMANGAMITKGFLEAYPAVYYFGFVAKALIDTMIVDDKVGTAGVSISGLTVSQKFFETMTPPQWNYAIAHEAGHARLDHLKRLEGKHKVVGNVAADLAVNSIIDEWLDIKTKVSEQWPYDHLFERPEGGCFAGEGDFADLPKGESTEWYYKELMKKGQQLAQQNQQGQPQQGGGQSQGQGQQCQNGQGGQPGQPQQGQGHPGQEGFPGGGGGGFQLDENPGFSEEELQKMAEAMHATGQIETDIADPAKQAALSELVDKLLQNATKQSENEIDNWQARVAAKHISGGLTKGKLDEYLNGPKNKDEQLARQFNRQNTAQSVSSGAAVRGVDGIVDRADDEAMWQDILEPIRIKVLTDERRYNHRRAVQMSIADGLSESLGQDVSLKGRIMGYSAGGEVLVIVDTSGSTQDYWQLSIAKCVECISSMAQNKVVLRVVVFSDNDPSVKDEFVFYNGDLVSEEDFSHESVVEDGVDLIPEHIVDVQDMIQSDTIETARLVGETITGGGGTAILPVVNKIKAVVGDDVTERFLVTVIITDAALYGPDVAWSQSTDVIDTFGEHVAWLFLDLYEENYDAIVGEKKYLISCKESGD